MYCTDSLGSHLAFSSSAMLYSFRVTTKTHKARSLRRNLAEPAKQWEHILVSVLAGIGVLHITALILLAVYRHHIWQTQILQTQVSIARLEREVDQLGVRVAHDATDQKYMESLARLQGFVRPDEHVIVPK